MLSFLRYLEKLINWYWLALDFDESNMPVIVSRLSFARNNTHTHTVLSLRISICLLLVSYFFWHLLSNPFICLKFFLPLINSLWNSLVNNIALILASAKIFVAFIPKESMVGYEILCSHFLCLKILDTLTPLRSVGSVAMVIAVLISFVCPSRSAGGVEKITNSSRHQNWEIRNRPL